MIASLIAFTICLSPAQANNELVWTSAWGVLSTKVSTPQGEATVYLPQDMRAGDRVSGSIIGAQKSVCVEAGNAHCDCETGVLTFEVPSGAASLPVKITDAHNNVIATVVAPLRTGDRSQPGGFHVAPVVQEGGAIYVSGPFDGDRKNTTVEIDGRSAGVIGETPRGLMVSAPAGYGAHKIEILEGNVRHAGQVNLVGLRMITPERIRRGKKGEVILEVRGLEGMADSAFPIEVEVRSHTPNIARFDKSTENPFRTRINAADVRDGVWTQKAPILAKKVGEYTITGYVYAPGFPYASDY